MRLPFIRFHDRSFHIDWLVLDRFDLDGEADVVADSRYAVPAIESAVTSLPRMVHLSFSTDPAAVQASKHPNARLFFRSRPETDRRAQ